MDNLYKPTGGTIRAFIHYGIKIKIDKTLYLIKIPNFTYYGTWKIQRALPPCARLLRGFLYSVCEN